MNNEADIITILCAEFADKYKPLTRAEFWKLFHRCGDSVKAMAEADEGRAAELMQRQGVIAFGKEKLEQLGVKIVTVADDDFPSRLQENLKDFCPPLLYCSGNLGILRHKFVGYVGSRAIEEADIRWTEDRVQNNLTAGFGVVTGGAKGIDSVAAQYALQHGSPVVVFLPDSLKERLRDSSIRRHIYDEKLVVLSHVSPFAPKTRNSFVAAAMERNKYIYALSTGTAVVRSDLDKGGTWAGALEALKHNWGKVFVWDNKKYPGNQKLIELGAQGLSDEGERLASIDIPEQMDLFSENS